MWGGRGTSARHSYATILLRSLPKVLFFLLERERIVFTLFQTGMIIKIRDTQVGEKPVFLRLVMTHIYKPREEQRFKDVCSVDWCVWYVSIELKAN